MQESRVDQQRYLVLEEIRRFATKAVSRGRFGGAACDTAVEKVFDVAEKKWREDPEYFAKRRVPGWAVRAVRKCARDLELSATRRAAREGTYHTAMSQHHPEGMDPEEMLLEKDLAAYVDKGLRKLTPKLLRVAVLRLGHGLGRDEVARMLGMKPEHVDTYLHRARTQLRKALPELDTAKRLASVGAIIGSLFPDFGSGQEPEGAAAQPPRGARTPDARLAGVLASSQVLVASTPDERHARAQAEARFQAKLIPLFWSPRRPVRSAQDDVAVRKARWERYLLREGYVTIPPELSAEVLEVRYARKLAALRWRVYAPGFVIRRIVWSIIDHFHEPIDQPAGWED